MDNDGDTYKEKGSKRIEDNCIIRGKYIFLNVGGDLCLLNMED